MASDDLILKEKAPPATDPARLALVILAVFAVGAVVTYLGPILKPFLVAVFLFYTTRSAAEALVRRGFPPWLAYLTLFASCLVAVFTVSLFVYGEAMAFRDHWPQYQERILALIGQHTAGASPSLQELFEVSSHDVFAFAFERGVGAAELIIMVFFYLLFLLLGSRKLAHRVTRGFPGETGQRVLAIGEKISSGMERFMKVKTLVSLGMGATAAGLMYLFGLDHWLLWGFLFFALNYVTYIGSIIACVPPIALAYLDLSSPVWATVLAVLIVVNRFLWIDWVEIRLSGKHLNIDSALLFLWLAYWGWTWGVLGLILAYPMIVSLKIVLEHLENTKGWAVLMGEE
jgi:AI-2 transport protein TqsA